MGENKSGGKQLLTLAVGLVILAAMSNIMGGANDYTSLSDVTDSNFKPLNDVIKSDYNPFKDVADRSYGNDLIKNVSLDTYNPFDIVNYKPLTNSPSIARSPLPSIMLEEIR